MKSLYTGRLSSFNSTAMVKITEVWSAALNKKQHITVLAFDVFNSMCHNLLLAKRKAYGLNVSWSHSKNANNE